MILSLHTDLMIEKLLFLIIPHLCIFMGNGVIICIMYAIIVMIYFSSKGDHDKEVFAMKQQEK